MKRFEFWFKLLFILIAWVVNEEYIFCFCTMYFWICIKHSWDGTILVNVTKYTFFPQEIFRVQKWMRTLVLEHFVSHGKHYSCMFAEELKCSVFVISTSMVSFIAVNVLFVLVDTDKQNPGLFCWGHVFGILLRTLYLHVCLPLYNLLLWGLKISAKLSSTNI